MATQEFVTHSAEETIALGRTLAAMLTPDSPAVLVRDFKLDATYIITRWDIIKALS